MYHFKALMGFKSLYFYVYSDILFLSLNEKIEVNTEIGRFAWIMQRGHEEGATLVQEMHLLLVT